MQNVGINKKQESTKAIELFPDINTRNKLIGYIRAIDYSDRDLLVLEAKEKELSKIFWTFIILMISCLLICKDGVFFGSIFAMVASAFWLKKKEIHEKRLTELGNRMSFVHSLADHKIVCRGKDNEKGYFYCHGEITQEPLDDPRSTLEDCIRRGYVCSGTLIPITVKSDLTIDNVNLAR